MERLDLVRLRLGGGADNLGVREGPQLARVVDVLVGDQNLRDLLGAIAQLGERLPIGLDEAADIYGGVFVRCGIGELGGKAGVDENDFAPRVDDPVLQAGTVFIVLATFIVSRQSAA